MVSLGANGIVHYFPKPFDKQFSIFSYDSIDCSIILALMSVMTMPKPIIIMPTTMNSPIVDLRVGFGLHFFRNKH